MKIDKESKLIVQSINETIDDINEHSKKFQSEEDIQLRLFVHLCNNFDNEEKGSFDRIKIEYSPYDPKQKDYNKKYAKTLSKKQSHLEKLFSTDNKYTLHKDYKKNYKNLLKKIIVQGKFDIAIFDQERKKISHVIEIKKLTPAAFKPNLKSEIHRIIEDLYVLTDLLKPKYSNEIDAKCRGYNLIYEPESFKKLNSEVNEKIRSFSNDILNIYEKAGIYYIAILFNKSTAFNLKEEIPITGGKIE
mgnify:CR=1 FL=1